MICNNSFEIHPLKAFRYPSLSEPHKQSTRTGEQCPLALAGPKSSSSQCGAQSDLLLPVFWGVLTGLEERRYVAGVLRRLLRSFPGAHGCHNPPERGAQYPLSRSPQKPRKRWHQITSVPTKASLETHGRLRRLEDVSGAICRPPSWGNVIGNDQPGAPGSSSGVEPRGE